MTIRHQCLACHYMRLWGTVHSQTISTKKSCFDVSAYYQKQSKFYGELGGVWGMYLHSGILSDQPRGETEFQIHWQGKCSMAHCKVGKQ